VSSPAPSDRQEAGDSRRSSTGEWAPCEEKEEEKAAAAGGGIDLLPPPLRESRGGRPQARYSFFFTRAGKGVFYFRRFCQVKEWAQLSSVGGSLEQLQRME
jgi:hypothetical protein